MWNACFNVCLFRLLWDDLIWSLPLDCSESFSFPLHLHVYHAGSGWLCCSASQSENTFCHIIFFLENQTIHLRVCRNSGNPPAQTADLTRPNYYHYQFTRERWSLLMRHNLWVASEAMQCLFLCMCCCHSYSDYSPIKQEWFKSNENM